MERNAFYAPSYTAGPDLNAPLPPLPDNPSHESLFQVSRTHTHYLDNGAPDRGHDAGARYPPREQWTAKDDEDSLNDEDIRLETQYAKMDTAYGKDVPLPPRPTHRTSRKRRKQQTPFWSLKTPWITYVLTLIQVTVFIYEIIKNAILTGSPIAIHPQFNPMIGHSA